MSDSSRSQLSVSQTSHTNKTAEDVCALPVEQLKKRRANCRRTISTCCTYIETTIKESKSRRTATNLLTRARDAFSLLEQITQKLSEDLDEEEASAEEAKLLQYLSKLGEAQDAVELYVGTQSSQLALSGNESDTVASVTSDIPNEEERHLAEETAKKRVEVASRQEAAQKALAEAQLAQAAAEQSQQEVENLESQSARLRLSKRRQQASVGQTPSPSVIWASPRHEDSPWEVNRQNNPHSRKDPAPDEWIEDYLDGRPCYDSWSSEYGHQTSIKANLEPYDGCALQWFSWIDLFKALVHDSAKSPGEKLAILRRSMRGDCLDIVYGLGGGEEAYKEALGRLKETCGRRDVMRAAHFQALDKLDPGKGNASALKRFAEKVRTHLFDLARMGELAHADIIEKITAKLSVHDRLAWNEVKASQPESASLLKFGRWLCSRAAAYQNAYDIATEQSSKKPQGNRFNKKQVHSHQTAAGTAGAPNNHWEDPISNRKTLKCVKCEAEHHISSCAAFQALSVQERVEFAKNNKLCFACLRGQHYSLDCRNAKECGIVNCKRRHHRLLHSKSPEKTTSSNVHTAQREARRVAFGVIPVSVLDKDGNRQRATLMLDEGSDTTLIREGFLNKLGLQGEENQLRISGVAGAARECTSRKVTLCLESQTDGHRVVIQAHSIPKVCSPVVPVPWSSLQGQWPHLADLSLHEAGGPVDILLGLDHSELMLANEVRRGNSGEPVALNTVLGWVARGVIGTPLKPTRARINLLMEESVSSLDQDFRAFCNTESFGTESVVPMRLSPEAQRAKCIVDDGTRKLETGYEAPLPWKEGEPNLPDNKPLAEHRLRGLLKRFRSDPNYEADYRKAIEKYISEGYARLITNPSDLAGPQYFLPHHGVYKKSSKEKKLRVVFDSAAQYRGKCLNDALLTGPALQNELPTVLIKFREGAVAFTADITAMFSRIRLRPEDARYHRFLWPDKESGNTGVYQMDRVTFGDKCSPFVAINTIRRTASDYGEDKESAVRAIIEKLYVDDYLDSDKEVFEAFTRLKDVREILGKGDFHLSQWISNSQELMKLITAEFSIVQTSSSEDFSCTFGEDDSDTKVLGIRWKPTADVLTFQVANLEKVLFTRRGLLSKLAGIFDPLGLLSPVTVKAKIKHRELGLRGLNWDDTIPEEPKQWWQNWLDRLFELENLQVSRCLFDKEHLIEYSELHTFSDASQEAFAAAVYLRNVYTNGDVKVSLVMAKTKLAPIKTISIAKLELQAALLGARLASYVQCALTRSIRQRWFWTDSSCVRNWTRATAAFYKPFVSHRIGEIQTLTESKEWRFVPGRLNSSDLATRAIFELDSLIDETWWTGPPFLVQAEDTWPTDIPWILNTEEIRTSCEFKSLHVSVKPAQAVDWSKLTVSAEETAGFTKIDGQFLELLRVSQSKTFSTELVALQQGKTIKKTSKILPLNPMIGKDGLLRVGGRIRSAELPYDHKHPVILLAKHPLSLFLIKGFHESLHHAGTDHVLSHMRQHFWILCGREAVKKARRTCPKCVREFARPATQMMGDLPIERLAIGCPPFYHTSVDYFGPLEVSYGRNGSVKRYGAIFTCMTTRAVYLDLAHSLSASDFLLILRRFISTRGKPFSIYSDNGTNFVGAEKMLRQYSKELQGSSEVSSFCKQKGIRWKFQPPSAPHFGGVHESLVRSAKRALYRVLEIENQNHRILSEDILRTVLFEVAGFLNGRPLSYTSSDSNDFRPLTPNDFLNQQPGNPNPAGDFSHPAPKDRYKYVQHLATMVWDLWRKHYLPSLVARNKWRLKERSFQSGDVVLVVEPNQPRGKWCVGQVEETFPGADGLVRVAKVRTKHGIFLRPIHRLCLLEKCESSVPADPEHCSGGEDVRAKC